MEGIGIHVYAGGFSLGVQQVMPVRAHLAATDFGALTARRACGVEVYTEWPDIAADFAFGSPLALGSASNMLAYSLGRYPIIACDTYLTNKAALTKLCFEHNYKVAHVHVHSNSFGNCQMRKRYILFAYRPGANFNIEPPTLSEYVPKVFGAIWGLQDSTTKSGFLSQDEQITISMLPNGWDMNLFLAYNSDIAPQSLRSKPISVDCLRRLTWVSQSPRLFSSARWIHPDQDRLLTLEEYAAIAGWPCIPDGDAPIAQLARGTTPSIGEWVARQAVHYLTNAWGASDYESSFDAATQTWVGRNCNGAKEKTFDLTKYVSQNVRTDYPYDKFVRHLHNFHSDGSPIRPWPEVAESFRKNTLRWPTQAERDQLLLQKEIEQC